MGIKEKKPSASIDGQLDDLKGKDFGLPTFSFTKDEKNAWLKQGMPEITAFLEKYRKAKRGNKSRTTGG